MYVTEQYFLLSLEDTTGKISSSTAGYFAYGIAGAIFYDLYKMGKIQFEDKKVIPIDLNTIDDELFDFVLVELKKVNKPRQLSEWIQSTNNRYYELRDFLFKRLRTQGIIGREEKKVMRMFSFVTHPILRTEIKTHLLQEIEKVLMDDSLPSDDILLLLTLVKETNLINSLFPKEFRKQVKDRIEALTKNTQIGQAIRDICTAFDASFMVLIMVAIM